MDHKELIERLRIDAEWAEGQEWETPICLLDDLREAIAAIERWWLGMTRDEAIEYLNKCRKRAQECAEDFERAFPKHKSAWRRDVDVYDMAISALRAQQPAEKNEPQGGPT